MSMWYQLLCGSITSVTWTIATVPDHSFGVAAAAPCERTLKTFCHLWKGPICHRERQLLAHWEHVQHLVSWGRTKKTGRLGAEDVFVSKISWNIKIIPGLVVVSKPNPKQALSSEHSVRHSSKVSISSSASVAPKYRTFDSSSYEITQSPSER